MSISLESSLKTCKIDTAYANKVQSDRFLNPSNMVCPIWTGYDLTGRSAAPDSFYTKSAGCNSAVDRVLVENNQRPQYAEYINLSASGINASVYGDYQNTMPFVEAGDTNKNLRNIPNITGQFGQNFQASVYPGCNAYPYNQGMQQIKNPVAPQQPPKGMAMPPPEYYQQNPNPYQQQFQHQAQDFRVQGALQNGFIADQQLRQSGF